MKQKAATYLSTVKDKIISLNNYLYHNPEESYHEYKSSKYLVNILKDSDFEVEENFCNINTSFKAQTGSSYPKICLLCEYDCLPSKGQILGFNYLTSVSIASALALSHVINSIGGTIIVIGCPGELKAGSKVMMSKMGVFDDIDSVLMLQPHTHTAMNGSSPAVLPIKITFSTSTTSKYTPLDVCIFTLDSINMLLNDYCKDCSIDKLKIDGDLNPSVGPNTIELKLSIKAESLNSAYSIKKQIEEVCIFIKKLFCINYEISLDGVPYDTLLPNKTLNRIVAHNLKESGLIHLDNTKNYDFGLSLGDVSHIVPCIRPFISLSENIKFGTESFAHTTISENIIELIMKSSKALVNTAIDLIEKEELIQESKIELNKNNS
ncbi:M20 family peptidase [Clostridium sediminicola]|uniref:hypothetical protein n=1 Tax=Clostridium sediminicola TaxID=3114879 RepID=UPI0031F1FFB3